MKRISMFAILVLGAAGCGNGDRSGDTYTARDSAGIRIAENTAGAQGHPWTLGARPIIEIGGMEGDGPELFGSIRNAIWMATGEIGVADGLAGDIRIFSENGQHLRSFGRIGEGPGEFSQLRLVGMFRADSVAAIDNFGQRTSIFAAGGMYARSFNVPRFSGASAPNVVGWLHDGTLVISSLSVSPSQDTRSESTVRLYTVSPTGELSQDLGEFSNQRLGRNGLGLGFAGQAEFASGDSLIWYGHSDRFELVGRDQRGNINRIIRLDRRPRAVTDAEVAEARAAVEKSLAGMGGATVARIRETEFASAHPVHGRIFEDRIGRLWVERYRSRLLTTNEPREWDVFDPAGRLEGHLTVPDGLRVQQVRGDLLLGIYADSLGVERLRVYAIESE
jgi:hypothetical protein